MGLNDRQKTIHDLMSTVSSSAPASDLLDPRDAAGYPAAITVGEIERLVNKAYRAGFDAASNFPKTGADPAKAQEYLNDLKSAQREVFRLRAEITLALQFQEHADSQLHAIAQAWRTINSTLEIVAVGDPPAKFEPDEELDEGM